MVKVILTDLSRTLLFPKDNSYRGSLNALHHHLATQPGYNFWDHFILNSELIEFFNTLKDKVSIYIFTTGTIQDTPELKQELQKFAKGVFSTAHEGLDKGSDDSFTQISRELEVLPHEMLFIDDNVGNLEAAKPAGLKIARFIDNQQIKSEIEEVLK